LVFGAVVLAGTGLSQARGILSETFFACIGRARVVGLFVRVLLLKLAGKGIGIPNIISVTLLFVVLGKTASH